MKRPIVASNWKLYKDFSEAQSFLKSLKSAVMAAELEQHFLFFPPAIHFGLFQKEGLKFGLQNAHTELEGAFTGENSAAGAKSYGATHLLIGHSERRQYFQETDATCNKKLALALSVGLIPVLCIGETLSEREAGSTNSVLERQLLGALNTFIGDAKKLAGLIVAYEPVWAIGTGKVATPEQVESAHSLIRGWLLSKLSGSVAPTISILYGGSVKPENAAELSRLPSVDGFLIGSASLKIDSIEGIFRAALK